MHCNILLLLIGSLLLAGCAADAGVEETEAAGDGAVPGFVEDTTEEDVTAAPEEEEPPPADVQDDTTEPTPQPTAEATEWGTECSNDYDCAWDQNEACKRGYCVPQECVFSSSCQPEKDHCFNGKCYTEAELYAEFSKCAVNIFYCDIVCDGCKEGKRSCIMTGHSSGETTVEYRICVDCTTDNNCIEGYRCVDHYCVPGPRE
jgi:hypothetical protein